MKKIVSHNKYSQYLSTFKNINSIEVLETGDVKFDLHLESGVYSLLFVGLTDYKMPVVFLCNPEDGITRKPHQLHLQKRELIHLCLSVRDDISVKNKSYKEIVDYTITRVERLLSLSDTEELREFRKEFLYFWNKVSINDKKVELYIETSKVAKKLHLFKMNKSLIAYDSELSINGNFREKWTKQSKEILYIPLINSSKIMPPFEDEKWDVERLQYILNNCISEENIEIIESLNIQSRSVFLVFEMEIPEVLPMTFLLSISLGNHSNGNLFDRLHNILKVEHYSSQRYDSGYLFNRIGVRNFCRDKNVLLVGAGSLGSYLANELPKIGVNKITIFDDDEFSVENIMRHQLGSFYDGFNKARAIKFQLELNYPEVMITSKAERFYESKLKDYVLEEYNLIIITTGGTDFMLRLNKKFKDIDLRVPVVYSWIEANGLGVHALPVDYSKKGCFQCLYTNTTINKAHYGDLNNKSNAIGTGCGGVFNPYGNLTLLKGTAMILELIQLQLNEQLSGDINQIHSVRTGNTEFGKYFSLSRRDFETSKDFYYDERCEICGTHL